MAKVVTPDIEAEQQENTQTKQKKPKSNRSLFVKPLTVLAVICLVVYAVCMIISQQAQIAQLEKQTADITEKITVAKQENDEYIRLLSEDDEDAYMERIAIERLGYAYPNERRFYIINGD